MQDFKGKPLHTLRVWLLWSIAIALLGYVASRLIAAGDVLGLAASLLVFIAFFFGSAGWMFYFQLTGNQLIIRNHQCFWYRKPIDLTIISNIEVVRDGNTGIATNWTGYRRSWPVALRIYLSPEYPKTYYACTLNQQQWEALEAAFRARKTA